MPFILVSDSTHSHTQDNIDARPAPTPIRLPGEFFFLFFQNCSVGESRVPLSLRHQQALALSGKREAL